MVRTNGHLSSKRSISSGRTGHMSLAAKVYAYSVIGIGGVILVASLPNGLADQPVSFLIYFTLSVVASMLKFRLPGIEGTYSVSFLFTLIGIPEFTLPYTLVATCVCPVIHYVL